MNNAGEHDTGVDVQNSGGQRRGVQPEHKSLEADVLLKQLPEDAEAACTG